MTIAEICLICSTAVATVTVVLSVVKVWMDRRDKKLTHLVNTTRRELLVALSSNIERQFAGQDKGTYLTLDYRMDGDTKCVRIPLDYNKVTECLQGMRLQLVDHSGQETTYSMSTLGYSSPVRLHWHYHEEMEVVQVIRGHVTDVRTGRRYGPNEIWVIAPEARHIADFDNCFALCTVKPPLPYASQHPIDLDGYPDAYEAPCPKDVCDLNTCADTNCPRHAKSAAQ